VAHAGLADFGMCLIRPPLGCRGCVKTGRAVDVVDIDDAMTVEDGLEEADGIVDAFVETCEIRTALDCVNNGGLSEPGHGLFLGPCR
jgi:hypothetical protein